jgi:hypothetical protein
MSIPCTIANSPPQTIIQGGKMYSVFPERHMSIFTIRLLHNLMTLQPPIPYLHKTLKLYNTKSHESDMRTYA